MKKIAIGLAVAALALSGPALAEKKDKKMMKNEAAATGTQSAEVGRGGLKEWPVSEKPADWSKAAPSSASTGASSGTSGEGMGK